MANRSIEELSELFAQFPGVGPRQARRMVQFLLGKGGPFRENIARAIVEVASSTKQCADCYRYDDVNDAGLCRICADRGREPALMVVEKDVDIEGIEDSGAYRGRYFVLGGLMTLSDKKPRGAFRNAELRSRIGRDGITEVIFALATTPEGDYTSRELMKEIQTAEKAMRTTILGRGLSVGAEIEYADSETLRNALKNRA